MYYMNHLMIVLSKPENKVRETKLVILTLRSLVKQQKHYNYYVTNCIMNFNSLIEFIISQEANGIIKMFLTIRANFSRP